jgi:hypothetical protein
VPEAPDYAEVGRKAHELAHTNGAWNAFTYANRQAQRALATGETDEHAFWKAVADSLKPRQAANLVQAARMKSHEENIGAGEGNPTLVFSLEPGKTLLVIDFTQTNMADFEALTKSAGGIVVRTR